MFRWIYLLRFGELYLKGHNRNIFENTLINNIKKKLAGEKFSFSKTYGRYIVSGYDEKNEDKILECLQNENFSKIPIQIVHRIIEKSDMTHTPITPLRCALRACLLCSVNAFHVSWLWRPMIFGCD